MLPNYQSRRMDGAGRAYTARFLKLLKEAEVTDLRGFTRAKPE
jgi:hypothetical protein